jgi:arginine-tRNA-protein transferase
MSQSQQLPLLITPEHPCPYLDDQQAKTIFVSPEVEFNPTLYSALANQGFRRSGEQVYRPHCDNCQACISTRVPVNQFKATRSQKRCAKRFNQFRFEIKPARSSKQHFALFENYINQRHSDGDMYPTSEKQFKEFLLCDWVECYFLDFIHLESNQLVATAVFDQLQDGLSAVYTFFNPDYEKLSLGKVAILYLIELTKQHQLDYLYLGYWIKQSPKMAYKGQYRPIECFVNQGWTQLN